MMQKPIDHKPHRPSRGLCIQPKGALSGSSLVDSEKQATAARMVDITSSTSCKRAGGWSDAGETVKLRVGTVNVGTMSRRSGEIAEMAGRRKLDFCCVQETRWKGGSARTIGSEGAWYKFFWVGCAEGVSGVGILVAERWVDNVIEVKRVNERVMILRVIVGKSVLNVVSVYAPQVGRPMAEKEEFLVVLGKVLTDIGDSEMLVVCGDMNGHVGAKAEEFEGVHGGNGFGNRNIEGEMLLEFAQAMGLIVTNTWFQKRDSRKISYESGGCKTVVDYVLVRRCNRQMVRDVNVIPSEACVPQHKLLVCEMVLVEIVKKKREVLMSKCRVWKLKDPEVQKTYRAKVQARAEMRAKGDGIDVERVWKDMKECLLVCADEVCGRTKGPPRHKQTWWWNDDVAKAVEEKRLRFVSWRKSKCRLDKKAYDMAKKAASREVAKAQECERKKFGDMLDKENGKGNLFRIVNQVTGNNKDVVGGGCVKDRSGKVVTEVEKIKEVWREYFDKLLNEEFIWDRNSLETVDEMSGPRESITTNEVRLAIAKMKDGKAAGPSGVLSEMLKAAGEPGVQWVTDL